MGGDQLPSFVCAKVSKLFGGGREEDLIVKKDVKEIKCPPHQDKWGKWMFKRLQSELEAVGYLAIDEAALMNFLTSFSYWLQATQMIKKEGLVIKTPNGSKQIHPAHSIVKQNGELMKKYIQELGFSPGARKRLRINMDDLEDDNDLFKDWNGND